MSEKLTRQNKWFQSGLLRHPLLKSATTLTLAFAAGNMDAQAQNCYDLGSCSDYANFGYNSETFEDSTGTCAATLEYDNYVSGFHSTVVRDIDGTLKIWGELSGWQGTLDYSHLVPTEINAANYPGLTGVPLKVAIGSDGIYRTSTDIEGPQFILLTSDNKLWAWGKQGRVLSDDLKSTKAFQQLALGLPSGVTAADVKMLFATKENLVITTCSGNVWVINLMEPWFGSYNIGRANRGAGTTATPHTQWYRVEKSAGVPLNNIVVARGSRFGMFALDSNGDLWTWGGICYLGNGSTYSTLTRAQQMTKPDHSGTIKMIGKSDNTYYVLYEDGYLYALGHNSRGALGIWTTGGTSTTWVQPRYDSADATSTMKDVVWISPNEHDTYHSAGSINILNKSKKIWNFGAETGGMLGRGNISSSVGSSIPPTTTNHPGQPFDFEYGYSNEDIIAVETGGHTTMILRECADNFGYVGHRVHGSMGDNDTANYYDNIVHFNTNAIQACGAPTVDASIIPSLLGPYSTGQTITLTASPAGGTLIIDTSSAYTGTATLDALTGELTFTGAGNIRVNYTVTTSCGIVVVNKLFSAQNLPYPIIIPGSVWNDADGDALRDTITEPLLSNDFWAVLTNADGMVIASVKIADDGTYQFELEQSVLSATGNYKIILKNAGVIPGGIVTTSDDPLNGYEYTGTNRDNTVANLSENGGILNLGDLSLVSAGTTVGSANFGIGSTSPMPVEMLYFTANSQNSATLLSWATASEQNNKGFDIERSSDSRSWNRIGFVSSKAESGGNSSFQLGYSFIDNTPASGQNFYRLKQIDFDGKYEYSPVRMVSFKNANKVAIYPNPAKDNITVTGLNGGERIKLIDISGKMIKEVKAGNSSVEMSLDGLSDGIYSVHIYSNNGLITQKVVKLK